MHVRVHIIYKCPQNETILPRIYSYQIQKSRDLLYKQRPFIKKMYIRIFCSYARNTLRI